MNMKTHNKKTCIASYLHLVFGFLFVAFSWGTLAAPRLAFSDLVNGPVSGLNDGLGQGAIVTIWGYRLGDERGAVIFEDSQGKRSSAAHIYYWKKADGKLPSGPANLYKSHQLYEVAFSMPTVPLGTGKIFLQHQDGSLSNPLPFTAIEGRIFHVKNSGNNLNDGSFKSPWLFLNGDDTKIPAAGNGKLTAGDIVYLHNTTERLADYAGASHRAAIFLRNIKGLETAHVALVSYPNTVATVESPTWGIHPYLSTGIVVSKFVIKGGMIEDKNSSEVIPPTSPSTAQITSTQNGRIVANALTDLEGRCSNGYAGAITGGEEATDNLQVLGNEIFGIGCKQTSHFHHTTYFTRRTQTGANAIRAGQFAWNYLHDNEAKYGIHYYDQTNNSEKSCDPIVGKLQIHHNLIENQRSAAISVRTTSSDLSKVCWELDVDIHNNIVVNTGLGPVAEITNGTQPYAVVIGGSIKGSFRIFHNLFFKVSDESARLFGLPAVISYTNPDRISNLLVVNNMIDAGVNMPIVEGPEHVATNNSITPPAVDSTFDKFVSWGRQSLDNSNIYSERPFTFTDRFSLNEKMISGQSAKNVESIMLDFYGNDYPKQSVLIGPLQLVDN